MGMISEYIKLLNKKRKWRQKNSSNYTQMVNDFNINLVNVGRYTYGGLNVLTFNDKNRLKIGSFCSIGPAVTFIVSADHYLDRFSTYPFHVYAFHDKENEGISSGDIVIDDDVWIGYGATVLSGVHIGQGAVIGAGAVVTGDIPPYAVAAGVPAKVIKYRFDEKTAAKMTEFDFSKVDKKFLKQNRKNIYRKMSSEKDTEWLFK